MKLFILSILFSSFAFSHIFTDAISNGDKEKLLELIENGNDVNSYNYEIEFAPLYSAVTSGNLEIMLIMLQNGANPNTFINFGEITSDHVLSEARTIQEIVLLLSFGANPHTYRNWECNKAVYERRYLHLFTYYFWNLSNKVVPPKDLLGLNKILFKLPVLIIQSYITILSEGIPMDLLPPRDQDILNSILN
ncbi:hypothetical protein [Candidatus Sororendozoicomonas aggregata]|uniref:hypothetical protein n=1 Tax=Candidatus Sororendozoicomonas aggregata TaxID=3073239 RepID=UPI002ECFFDDA